MTEKLLILLVLVEQLGESQEYFDLSAFIGIEEDYAKDGGEELFFKMHSVLITNP